MRDTTYRESCCFDAIEVCFGSFRLHGFVFSGCKSLVPINVDARGLDLSEAWRASESKSVLKQDGPASHSYPTEAKLERVRRSILVAVQHDVQWGACGVKQLLLSVRSTALAARSIHLVGR